MTTQAPTIPILKGPAFAERLAEVCHDGLPAIRRLPDLRYERILIPHLVGGELPYALHGVIGQALRMRGAEVTALVCDSFLPACVSRKVDHYESACTRWCHRNAEPFARAMGLPCRPSQRVSRRGGHPRLRPTRRRGSRATPSRASRPTASITGR